MADLNLALNSKADNNVVQGLINQKISISEFEEMKNVIDKILKEFDSKIGIKDFEFSFGNTKHLVEEIQRELLLKANIKDVCLLLDSKAGKFNILLILTLNYTKFSFKFLIFYVKLNV